ncbi:MAG TPA: class I SAM-dependent methyltransferase [Streptosporangiaceae bacterium]|nr:class I SAM-dependent methyltransferase [Streptosporangiaceae bacterium]
MPDEDRHLDRRRAQAASFGAVAAAYERGRPPYPSEAIDWLLPAGATRVLDLGAGTGKLTRQLRDRGLRVVAVEPSAQMREQLASVVPGVPVHAGSAEDIPLGDGSVDAVLVAQAWHWVDPGRAVPEVARVLVPGGQLGLAWNLRDERADWVASLGRILHDPGETGGSRTHGITSPPFGAVQRLTVGWAHRVTRDALLDLVSSRSYVITMPAAQRAVVLAEVSRLADTHPALAGHDEFTLPYVTECFRAQLA